jgi:hypothetical protein
MRHVIYILLVMNLVYFSWNMLQNLPHEAGARPVRRLPPHVSQLETIQERAQKQAPVATADDRDRGVDASLAGGSAGTAEAEPETTAINRVEALTTAEPPGAIAPPSSCHVLGPFSDKSELAAVQDRLIQLGYEPREHISDIRVPAGYWVSLPAMKRDEALRITRLLEKNNDRDYLILKDNAIALGAYDSASRADTRLKKLYKYGLEAVAQPRYVTRTAYWLDIDLLDGERAVLDTIRDASPDVEVQEAAACE